MKGKRWIAGIISTTMLLSIMPIYAFAVDEQDDNLGIAVGDYVTAQFEKIGDKIQGKFTIAEDAPADEELEIELSSLFYDDNLSLSVLPGDTVEIDYTIQNLSSNDYKYKEGSFVLTPPDLSDYAETPEALSGFYGQDGQNIPYIMLGALTYSDPIQKLLGTGGNPSIGETLELYNKLADKGYIGDTALTDYVLDFYEVSSVEELYAMKFSSFRKFMGGNAANYRISEEDLEELAAEVQEDPGKAKLMQYATYDPEDEFFQFKLPEEELAVACYDEFYSALIGMAYGEEAISELNPNFSSSDTEARREFTDSCVSDYTDQEGEKYKAADTYMQQVLGGEDRIAAGSNSQTIETAFLVNGPDTGNSFQNYDFSWYSSITLEPILRTGALTIEKTVSGLPADLIPDSFTFDVISNEDMKTAAEVTVSDEDGDGIFTGTGTIEDLPYGEYTITEQPEEVADYHCETAITPEIITIDEETPDVTVAVTNDYDKEQVTITVHYYIEGTTTRLQEDTILVVDKNSNYDVSDYPASIGDYSYESMMGDDLTGLADGNKTIIIYYERDSDSGVHHPEYDPDRDDDDEPADEPDEEIPEEEVPLAETPWLNTVDHYAYIVGYPEDYVTGQPTEDESRWPIKPQANITRAEVATIFFRLLTDEARDQFWMTTNDFPDVAADAWYNNAISTMVNAGIIQGYEDGTFRPNDNITRAEFAAIASRFMSSGYDVEEDLFTDISGHWARENINDAAMTKWINGYPDGTFLPDNDITRAEAVTLVNNVLRRAPDADHMLDSMIKWPDNMDTSAWYYEAMQEATNSHDYDMFEGAEYETWTALEENRDWAALEQDWMNAHRGGGEVM